MASIRKIQSNRFEVQIRRVGWPQVTRQFGTREEALAWASEQEVRIKDGRYRDLSVLRSVTVAMLLRRYRDEVSPTKKGAGVEVVRLNAMLKQPFASATLAVLSPSMLMAWRDQRLAKVAGSTVNREINLLQDVFSVAIKDWGYAFEHPLHDFRRPKNPRGRRRILNWRELRALASELNLDVASRQGSLQSQPASGSRNLWAGRVVALAIRTAMRRSELLALQWSDVDLEERTLHVRDSKNGDERFVPLSTPAVRALSRMKRGAPGERVFPVSADALKKAFERARERANVRDLHFHDLRHHATTMLALRLNQLELAAVTGHKTIAMLARYYHPRGRDLARKLA
jgi:integrase